jgi:hypothetical protein
MLRAILKDDCHGQLQQECRYDYFHFFYLAQVSCPLLSGEMIDKLTLTYNRTRQSVITGELIEIISGAAAL